MAARDPRPVLASALAIGRKSCRPLVAYRAADRRWWLWLPCRCCGGSELPLSGKDPDSLGELERIVVGGAGEPIAVGGAVDEGGRRPCPACETTRRREVPDDGPRSVWYDTQLLEWVLRLATPDGAGVVLPLGIDSFDASLADVYRAAGDIAYSGDEFDAASRRRDSWSDGTS